MDKIKDSLKSLDFFGEIPQLYTNETTQYQKELGGIITLMVLAIGIVGFIFFGQELWEKKIPTVNQSVMYDPSPDALRIDFDTFDFFIRLQDPSNIGFIDPSIYTVKGFINTVLPNGSFPSLEIDLEPCQNSSFTQENLDLFYPYNFNGSWCISKNQSKISLDEIRLEKSFGQIGFHMLIFKFYSCVNKTGGIKCANAEKMSTYLDNAYLALYTLDNFIQTNNFNNPTSKAVKNLFFTVSKNFYASTTLFYDRCVVTSDVGVMFSDSRNQESFTTNPLLTNINTSGSTKFASFALQLSNVKKLFFRKYMKLPEMIAQVGGLLQFVKICAVILYTNYNQHFYFQDLFNNFFSYKPNSENDSQSKKTNNNLNHSNTFKLVETTLKSNANNLENTTNLKNLSKTNPRIKSDIEDNINDKTEKNLSVEKSPKNQIRKNNFLEGQSLTKPNTRRASLFKNINIGGGKLNFNHFHAIFCITMLNCCYKSKMKEKIKVFDHATKILREKLNITNLIKAYLDIEKLKYVMMSSDQLILFELIENPKIDLDLLNEKSKKIDTLAEYLLNKKNINQYNKNELNIFFEKLITSDDLISKKIILAHSESLS